MDKFLQLYREKFGEANLTPAVVFGGVAMAFMVGLVPMLVFAGFIAAVALEDKYLLNEEGK
jgi:hypothetical protein